MEVGAPYPPSYLSSRDIRGTGKLIFIPYRMNDSAPVMEEEFKDVEEQTGSHFPPTEPKSDDMVEISLPKTNKVRDSQLKESIP
jgi:hypothetical protein